MFIEFKGEKHEGLRKKSGEFTSNDWDVRGQCVARVYATSCVFGFFSNILAIGVCWDKCFLIHLKKTSKDLTILNIIYFVPDLMSEVWTLFSKQAYENRSITYVNEEDTKLLIQSLHALVPYSPFYCRSQWIGSSMHNVYAITLPQLLRSSTDKRLTFAVSKNLKHFAMKIIPDQKLFDNEVKCLEKINSYIQENSDKVEFTCTFYALGCKKRIKKEVQSFSLEAQSNFQTYRTLIPPLIKPKISLEYSFFFLISLREFVSCTNTCMYPRDGVCDDPRGTKYCELGTDCQDCGPVGADNFTRVDDDQDDDDYWTFNDADFLDQADGLEKNRHKVKVFKRQESGGTGPLLMMVLEGMVYTICAIFVALYIMNRWYQG
eukprot:gene18008-20887_t